MRININKLEQAGYVVLTDDSEGTIDIHPEKGCGVRLDFSTMNEQLDCLDLPDRVIEEELFDLQERLQTAQIMQIINRR